MLRLPGSECLLAVVALVMTAQQAAAQIGNTGSNGFSIGQQTYFSCSGRLYTYPYPGCTYANYNTGLTQSPYSYNTGQNQSPYSSYNSGQNQYNPYSSYSNGLTQSPYGSYNNGLNQQYPYGQYNNAQYPSQQLQYASPTNTLGTGYNPTATTGNAVSPSNTFYY